MCIRTNAILFLLEIFMHFIICHLNSATNAASYWNQCIFSFVLNISEATRNLCFFSSGVCHILMDSILLHCVRCNFIRQIRLYISHLSQRYLFSFPFLPRLATMNIVVQCALRCLFLGNNGLQYRKRGMFNGSHESMNVLKLSKFFSG